MKDEVTLKRVQQNISEMLLRAARQQSDLDGAACGIAVSIAVLVNLLTELHKSGALSHDQIDTITGRSC